ncbi:MAG TPA: helix-hairpin-helix domain-containing protein [Methylibium sp.]|nr:helix-hairpin-helix domain-containing protein [Methylibium sp.]
MIKHFAAFILSFAAAAAMAAVDVNKADQAALESVRGVGPGLSGKLMEARKQTAFKNWQDLIDRVGGVGPGSAARLSAAGLTVNGEAYTAAAQPATTPKAPAPRKPAADKADKTAKKG